VTERAVDEGDAGQAPLDTAVDGAVGEPGWFGVRCIFRWSQPPTYEERITLWRAESLDDAIARAEEEATAYALRLGSEYLDIAQAYWIGGRQPAHGSEVFSLMRDSELEPDDYLDSFYDTGRERQRTDI
jgi:hypothetical protein